MDAIRLSPPRRLAVPVENRWGAGSMSVLDFGDPERPVDLIFVLLCESSDERRGQLDRNLEHMQDLLDS